MCKHILICSLQWTGYTSLTYEIPLDVHDGRVSMQALARRVSRACVHYLQACLLVSFSSFQSLMSLCSRPMSFLFPGIESNCTTSRKSRMACGSRCCRRADLLFPLDPSSSKMARGLVLGPSRHQRDDLFSIASWLYDYNDLHDMIFGPDTILISSCYNMYNPQAFVPNIINTP